MELLTLTNLKPAPGSRKKRKRVGRGIGSGHGKTSTRGHNGQHARNTTARGNEGGQTPLYQRLPKLRGKAKGAMASGPDPQTLRHRQPRNVGSARKRRRRQRQIAARKRHGQRPLGRLARVGRRRVDQTADDPSQPLHRNGARENRSRRWHRRTDLIFRHPTNSRVFRRESAAVVV